MRLYGIIFLICNRQGYTWLTVIHWQTEFPPMGGDKLDVSNVTPNPRPDWSRGVMDKIKEGTIKRIKYLDPDVVGAQENQSAPAKKPRLDPVHLEETKPVVIVAEVEEGDGPVQPNVDLQRSARFVMPGPGPWLGDALAGPLGPQPPILALTPTPTLTCTHGWQCHWGWRQRRWWQEGWRYGWRRVSHPCSTHPCVCQYRHEVVPGPGPEQRSAWVQRISGGQERSHKSLGHRGLRLGQDGCWIPSTQTLDMSGPVLKGGLLGAPGQHSPDWVQGPPLGDEAGAQDARQEVH